MINGIAWDDEPGEYIERLAQHLNKYGIKLNIFSDPEKFVEECQIQRFDFAVVDLLDAAPFSGSSQLIGPALLRAAFASNPSLPGFILTGAYDASILDKRREGLPPSVAVKSKTLMPSFMAYDIVEELRTRGVLFNASKVIVSDGGDDESRDLAKGVIEWLGERRLQPHYLSLGDAVSKTGNGLSEEIRDAAAVLLIWPRKSKQEQVLQRCLLHVGIVYGGGVGHRVTILEQVIDSEDSIIQFPNDLSPAVVRVKRDGADGFIELGARLTDLGVGGLK